MHPLAGFLVADLSRYLPGAYATRELQRLGARVVRLEPPEGDPLRRTAPAWHEALNAGKESIVCDLKADPELGRALCRRADVGDRVVYCSLTGFGTDGRHAARAGHDLNYLGWAGVLHDTAPSLPPIQVADLAAGALAAALEIVAALLDRERTGRGRHVVVSMTHGSHALAAHRLGGEPIPRLLTGGLACYRVYATADGRHVTVAALEPKFFMRLCELLERDELARRQYDTDAQEQLADALAGAFRERPLAEWLALFDDEDVCVGPVATLDESAEEFGLATPAGRAPALGEHTDAWRAELSRS